MMNPESFHIYCIQKLWRSGAETRFFRVSDDNKRAALEILKKRFQEAIGEIDRYLSDDSNFQDQ